jgi:hypothetical protein
MFLAALFGEEQMEKLIAISIEREQSNGRTWEAIPYCPGSEPLAVYSVRGHRRLGFSI